MDTSNCLWRNKSDNLLQTQLHKHSGMKAGFVIRVDFEVITWWKGLEKQTKYTIFTNADPSYLDT